MRTIYSHRGFTLLSLLFLTFLIGLIVSGMVFLAQRSIILDQSELHTDQSRRIALNTLFQKLTKTSTAQIDFTTIQSNGNIGLTNISRNLLVINGSSSANFPPLLTKTNLKNGVQFPLIDYGALFEKKDPCVDAIPGAPTKTLGGMSLGILSAKSSIICKSIPSSITKFIIKGNFDLSTPIYIEPTPGEVALIASTGYFAHTGTVSVKGNIILVAGGDLLLSHLLASQSKESFLTLISATGNVIIQKISGLIHIRVIGWEGISIPSSVQFSNKAPLPALIEKSIIGVQ